MAIDDHMQEVRRVALAREFHGSRKALQERYAQKSVGMGWIYLGKQRQMPHFLNFFRAHGYVPPLEHASSVSQAGT